jgi:hypothetical protein
MSGPISRADMCWAVTLPIVNLDIARSLPADPRIQIAAAQALGATK